MQYQTCRLCGGPRRANGSPVQAPGYVNAAGVCYECHIAGLIPKWAMQAEQYCNGNATRRIKLGIPWLDQQPPRVCDFWPWGFLQR